MNPAPAAPESPQWIEIRRFATWRGLRDWVARQASLASAQPDGERLQLVVPTPGAAWVLDRTLRARLPEGSSLPWIGVADSAFRDLPGDLDPPFRAAPRLTREILIEEALLAGASEPEAPPGDPAQLAEPLLAFLDEQARDARIRPDRTAFEAFAARTEKNLAEAQETDQGAVRLLRLTRWLRRVHGRYLTALEEAGRADPGSLRERLFLNAAALAPSLAGLRVVGVGEDALRPSDAELLAALLRPGKLVWALPGDAPPPRLPTGLPVREARIDGEARPGEAVPTRAHRQGQPTLFAASRPLGTGDAAGAREQPEENPAPIYIPATGDGLVFRATDRADEIRVAAALLTNFRRSGANHGRMALVAQQPSRYLETIEVALSGCNIPFETHLQPRLSTEPWVAALSDVLEFGARPGRLTLGLRLLRSPFVRTPDLAAAPQRAADILQQQLVDAGIRDTHTPEELPRLVAHLSRLAERSRQRLPGADSPDRATREVERWIARAEDQETAAAALETLNAAAGALAPLRDPGVAFSDAVEALLRFLDRFVEPPADEDAAVREAVFRTLRQAAAAAPGGARAGAPGGFARRIRRLLNRRASEPRPSPGSGKESSGEGVSLIAAADAPFGDYDFLVLLGVADADWPGPRPRNIFFPNNLLEEATRSRQARARNREIRLLRAIPALPRSGVAFTRPELDDGFPVAASPFEVELVEAMEGREPAADRIPVRGPLSPGGAPGPGEITPLPTTLDRRAPSAAVLERPVSPTALDTYAESPAQFFARYVLRLPEERPLADVPPPTERGELLHDFLHRSYEALPGAGLAAGESALDDLLGFFQTEFRRYAEVRGMEETERRIEERWLFGGEATPGAMEWFLREERDRGPFTPARFEEWIGGEPEAPAPAGPTLRVEGRLDRLDRRPDGTRRVLEYKSGRFYQKPLQARLYARVLEAADGIPTDFAIPYFGHRRWIGPADKPGDSEQDAEVAKARDGIARGAFPPAPAGDGNFAFHLVIRRDLPEPPPEPPESDAGS